MAKDDAAHRPRDEAYGEHTIGQQHRNQRVVGGKVQLVQHQAGNDAVEEEVIPFDDRAEHARDRGATQVG